VASEGLHESAVHGDRSVSFVSASVAPAGPVADDDLSTIAIFTLVTLQDQAIGGAHQGLSTR